jgi:pimeloyl-ACP methyl ester carboxylesterase
MPRLLCLALAFVACAVAAKEEHPGLSVEYGTLDVPGAKLRTILTKPAAARPPVILFVQWLSCDSVELPAKGSDGWVEMMRGLVRDSGWAVMRTDKRGVGESSGGPCANLDYETELSDHRAALAALRQRTDVDPSRIVVFGASMGGNYAPLVAAGNDAGVMIWGGGAKTWFERTLGFERRAKEFDGTPAGEVDAYLKSLTRFLVGYLLDRQTPDAIAKRDPSLAGVWKRIVGTDAQSHYGRPFAFHQQAQAQNWPAAWAKVEAPVLVLYGEYDWFEDAAGHRLVADIVNRAHPGRARFVVIPQTNHHFSRFASAETAFRGKDGKVDAAPALAEMRHWLKERALR